jgi:mannitol/fructose-specific phosphotransferase system IIA component (Ntr-type)
VAVQFIMELTDLIKPELILTDLKSKNRWEVIEELIDYLVEKKVIKAEDRDSIVDVVKKREQTMSTGIGFGVGLPHASTTLISEVVGVMGRSKEGIEFDALDNQKVKLVLLFLVPKGQFQKHLHTLSNIAKLLHRQEFLQELLDAPDANAMYEIIKKYSKGSHIDGK